MRRLTQAVVAVGGTLVVASCITLFDDDTTCYGDEFPCGPTETTSSSSSAGGSGGAPLPVGCACQAMALPDDKSQVAGQHCVCPAEVRSLDGPRSTLRSHCYGLDWSWTPHPGERIESVVTDVAPLFDDESLVLVSSHEPCGDDATPLCERLTLHRLDANGEAVFPEKVLVTCEDEVCQLKDTVLAVHASEGVAKVVVAGTYAGGTIELGFDDGPMEPAIRQGHDSFILRTTVEGGAAMAFSKDDAFCITGSKDDRLTGAAFDEATGELVVAGWAVKAHCIERCDRGCPADATPHQSVPSTEDCFSGTGPRLEVSEFAPVHRPPNGGGGTGGAGGGPGGAMNSCGTMRAAKGVNTSVRRFAFSHTLDDAGLTACSIFEVPDQDPEGERVDDVVNDVAVVGGRVFLAGYRTIEGNQDGLVLFYRPRTAEPARCLLAYAEEENQRLTHVAARRRGGEAETEVIVAGTIVGATPAAPGVCPQLPRELEGDNADLALAAITVDDQPSTPMTLDWARAFGSSSNDNVYGLDLDGDRLVLVGQSNQNLYAYDEDDLPAGGNAGVLIELVWDATEEWAGVPRFAMSRGTDVPRSSFEAVSLQDGRLIVGGLTRGRIILALPPTDVSESNLCALPGSICSPQKPRESTAFVFELIEPATTTDAPEGYRCPSVGESPGADNDDVCR